MGQSFMAELGEQVCTHKFQLIFGISLAVILAILSVVSLRVVNPASATYVIVVLNLVTLVCIVVIFSIVIVTCTRRGY